MPGTDINDAATLIFVTIHRDAAARRLVESVRRYYPDMPIVAADQNGRSSDMAAFYRGHGVRALWLDYDCGLSAARNSAIRAVTTPFALLADDDFVFTANTAVRDAVRVMQSDTSLGVLGGRLVDVTTGRDGIGQRTPRHWEKFFLPDWRGRILVTVPIDHLPPRPREVEGHTVYLCDMTINWGLFRMAMFEDGVQWDERIKINGEHEDFFLNLKENTGWQVAYLPGLECDHVPIRTAGYWDLRGRTDGRRTFARKWGFTHHLEIGVGLRDFSDYAAVASVPLPCPLGTGGGLPEDRDAQEEQAAAAGGARRPAPAPRQHGSAAGRDTRPRWMTALLAKLWKR